MQIGKKIRHDAPLAPNRTVAVDRETSPAGHPIVLVGDEVDPVLSLAVDLQSIFAARQGTTHGPRGLVFLLSGSVGVVCDSFVDDLGINAPGPSTGNRVQLEVETVDLTYQNLIVDEV